MLAPDLDFPEHNKLIGVMSSTHLKMTKGLEHFLYEKRLRNWTLCPGKERAKEDVIPVYK